MGHCAKGHFHSDGGLKLPLFYNTGGYDGPEALRLLDGVINIYLPDFKFWDPQVSGELAGAPDYPEVALRPSKKKQTPGNSGGA
jgi:putative pyruvate formate lyase activating enzyme